MKIVAMTSLVKMFTKNISKEQFSLLENPITSLTHNDNTPIFRDTNKVLINNVDIGCTDKELSNEFKEKKEEK